ncbi:MAG: radical SAM protein [Bacteroidetes bacterium]|nr:radical SAM protein [Bacteroidota bacterium]
MPERSWTYYDYTISLCSKCHRRVSAKIVFENSNVYMIKSCPDHGMEKILIATDIEYYKRIRNYNKRSEIPLKFNTPTLYGCPYDCGLCPDHEQHSCLTLIEVTDRCNLTCPTCYAESSPTFGRHRTLEEIKRMLDVIVENEGKPDVVQLSGGEPTIHPDFFEILDEAKKRPIKHLMLNTNGIRIAKEEDFVKRLATYMPDFEVYLQWDSFDNKALQKLRGADLLDIRLKAMEHLNKYNLSTTLVVTLQRGVNNHEIGKIIEYALQQPCVRGVTFQPTQVAGRNEQFNAATERYTLTEVRQDILDQAGIFNSDDLIPVPCNPDALVMGYALKLAGEVIPLTRYINPADLLDNSRNTIVYERDERLHGYVMKMFSTANSVDAITEDVNELLCCLPFVQAPNLSYENLFRIIIMNFIDAYNFDVRAIKKSCVHIVHNDKIIPFETMNLFYRNGKEKNLEVLRELKIV